MPSLSNCNLCGELTYGDDYFDRLYKKRGLIFKTREEAIDVAKKMLEVVK